MEQYRNKIKTVHGEALIEEWKKSVKNKTVYILKSARPAEPVGEEESGVSRSDAPGAAEASVGGGEEEGAVADGPSGAVRDDGTVVTEDAARTLDEELSSAVEDGSVSTEDTSVSAEDPSAVAEGGRDDKSSGPDRKEEEHTMTWIEAQSCLYGEICAPADPENQSYCCSSVRHPGIG